MTDAKLIRYAEKFQAPAPIVIMDIDDASYGAVPAVLPWPRSYYARLIRNMNRAGARLIIIDIMFDKPRVDDKAGDDSLAQAIKEAGNVILSGKTIVEDNMRAVVLPDPFLLNVCKSGFGIVNIKEDIDGVVREYYVTRPGEKNEPLPSLAVKAWMNIQGKPLDKSFEDEISFPIAYLGGAKSFTTIPVYQGIDDASFKTRDELDFGENINWFDTLKAQRILKDKIIFVGASLPELHDRVLTPFSIRSGSNTGNVIPGVEIHASALNTLLKNYKITNLNPWILFLLSFLLCASILFVSVNTRVIISFLYVFALSSTYICVSFFLFRINSLILPVVPVIFSCFISYAGQQSFLFYLEQRRRKKVTDMFGKYVPKQVVSEIIRNPEKMKLGGERRELTVLFSDLAGFTTLSENMEPEQLIHLLNEYLSAMTTIIHDNNGIIDKYEGDAIMAEFGIPLSFPDHAVRACEAAFAMQKKLREMGDLWKKQGKPQLAARVGIGTGYMVFGNMGSAQVFDYTVLGDVVNLSSRLEGVNKEYGTKIIINEDTYKQSEHAILARELDLIRVKGKVKPVKCYHLISMRNSPKATEIENVIRFFSQALLSYRAQDWDKALALFNEVLTIWPDDGPAKVYISRCTRFKEHTPTRDWDGVFTMERK